MTILSFLKLSGVEHFAIYFSARTRKVCISDTDAEDPAKSCVLHFGAQDSEILVGQYPDLMAPDTIRTILAMRHFVGQAKDGAEINLGSIRRSANLSDFL